MKDYRNPLLNMQESCLGKGGTNLSYESLYIYSIVTGDVCISNNCLPHHSLKEMRKKVPARKSFQPETSYFNLLIWNDGNWGCQNKSPSHMLDAHLQVQSTMWASSFLLICVVVKNFLIYINLVKLLFFGASTWHTKTISIFYTPEN